MSDINLYMIQHKLDIVIPPGWDAYKTLNRDLERETWHFRDFFDRYGTSVGSYIGLFSPRYREKIDISADEIRAYLDAHSGYDLYIFNPFPVFSYIFFNVWEQGFSCHAGLKARAIYLLDSVGASKNLICERHDNRIASYCNYFVGNEKFWSTYLEFLRPYQEFVDAEKLQGPLFDTCPYDRGEVNYIPFIFERFLSSFLADMKHIKVHAVDRGAWYVPGAAQQKQNIDNLDLSFLQGDENSNWTMKRALLDMRKAAVLLK